MFVFTNALATTVPANFTWDSTFNTSNPTGTHYMLPSALTNGTKAISLTQTVSGDVSNPSFEKNVYGLNGLRLGNKSAIVLAICVPLQTRLAMKQRLMTFPLPLPAILELMHFL